MPRVYCPVPGCVSVGFNNKAGLHSHIGRRHGPAVLAAVKSGRYRGAEPAAIQSPRDSIQAVKSLVLPRGVVLAADGRMVQCTREGLETVILTWTALDGTRIEQRMSLAAATAMIEAMTAVLKQ